MYFVSYRFVSSSNSLAVGSTAIAQVYLFAFAFKNQKINMIPKTIHYCWLSDEPIPANIQKYIDGWRKVMPEYRIKKWDKKAFDIHSVKWVEDAYAQKKWAFLCRLYPSLCIIY